MPKKVLFQEGGSVDGLVKIHTSDVEGIGSVYEDDIGRVFRFVKNSAGSALIAGGCALVTLKQTKAKATISRVRSPAATTGETALAAMPAGMPMTAIGASGSGTGAYGWIQVRGPAKVKFYPTTGADQAPTARMIGASTTGVWGVPVLPSSTAAIQIRGAEIVEQPTATTPATVAEALAYIHCF